MAAQPEDGLSVVSEAFEVVERNGERFFEAELYRVKGELLLQQGGCDDTDISEAEVCFHQSLDLARQQEAKSWELRAAMSLARLWQQQGKRQDACEVLVPVYEWFTEGFDTAGLLDAKVLLDELNS